MLEIICVDDQREVLTALDHDLEALGELYGVVLCESAAEAAEAMDEIDEAGGQVALVICDQVMPQQSGTDFLGRIRADTRFSHTRKILLTGLATQEDTIAAINEAGVDLYLEKPWDTERLLDGVRRLATGYVFAAGLDYLPYAPALDQQTLYDELRRRG